MACQSDSLYMQRLWHMILENAKWHIVFMVVLIRKLCRMAIASLCFTYIHNVFSLVSSSHGPALLLAVWRCESLGMRLGYTWRKAGRINFRCIKIPVILTNSAAFSITGLNLESEVVPFQ